MVVQVRGKVMVQSYEKTDFEPSRTLSCRAVSKLLMVVRVIILVCHFCLPPNLVSSEIRVLYVVVHDPCRSMRRPDVCSPTLNSSNLSSQRREIHPSFECYFPAICRLRVLPDRVYYSPGTLGRVREKNGYAVEFAM